MALTCGAGPEELQVGFHETVRITYDERFLTGLETINRRDSASKRKLNLSLSLTFQVSGAVSVDFN